VPCFALHLQKDYLARVAARRLAAQANHRATAECRKRNLQACREQTFIFFAMAAYSAGASLDEISIRLQTLGLDEASAEKMVELTCETVKDDRNTTSELDEPDDDALEDQQQCSYDEQLMALREMRLLTATAHKAQQGR
jgi:hypothetical protein